PQQLMQICDCICLTTYEETFGLVLPEAMRAGVAVIGSDKGGVPEIIAHQKTGLLFESENAESLYQQIAQLYDDPAMKQRLASEGRKKADSTFDNDLHFDKLENILSDVIKK
ncbi:MAG: glycosyltransferase family 4 protein, partial [Gammaproteobacteria bacterium]|nr:glycosyltransferase family 4 protein [Gammaproteobacteria bacterium]NNJ49145.1 glycosyltransferase family 4 protein [Gammaproteobacteria bacterium]